MKIVIVRHGDPDYQNDCLTEKGKREAECLAPRIQKMKFERCYVSPLGRARQTAEACLGPIGIEPVVLDWLQEVRTKVYRPNQAYRESVPWDWYPADWTSCDDFYTFDRWYEHPVFVQAGLKQDIENIYAGLEKLLNEMGYVKNGRFFKAVRPNNDTVLLFCHFGLECVIISYLLNISPMVLWQGFCAHTTSVTTVATEERIAGQAGFRVIEFGDTSHLYTAGEPCSFSGRFCECFTNEDERH